MKLGEGEKTEAERNKDVIHTVNSDVLAALLGLVKATTTTRWFKRDGSPKNLNSVINYSPSHRCKPLRQFVHLQNTN